MLKLTYTHRTKARYQVKVTDCEGNTETFESPKEAAEALKVERQTVYNAISHNLIVRGCTLEKVYNNEGYVINKKD